MTTFRKGQWVRYIGSSTVVFPRYVGPVLRTCKGLVHADFGRDYGCYPHNLEKLTRKQREQAAVDIAMEALGIDEEALS